MLLSPCNKEQLLLRAVLGLQREISRPFIGRGRDRRGGQAMVMIRVNEWQLGCENGSRVWICLWVVDVPKKKLTKVATKERRTFGAGEFSSLHYYL